MTQDSLARELSASGELSDDPIYDALVAALRSNARGRAFLDEYARRARAADTAAALNALARIETLLTRDGAADAAALGAPEARRDDEPMPAKVAAMIEIPPRRSTADLLTQVMALSPEERIALFS
jgi:hypothetical protein